LWVDRAVQARFDGMLWALPARVFARPLELYTGAMVDPERLRRELEVSGYRQSTRMSRAGSFRITRAGYEIATRGFRFNDRDREPARRVVVRFDGPRVARVSEGGRPLERLRLEPALVGRIFPANGEDRIPVRLRDVPPELVAGLLAVEDRQFYRHLGISLRGIARAMWANLLAGATVQGGSTVTQQLVKNLFLDRSRSIWRKLHEAAMALVLEARVSKRRILEAYLNEVYLGQDGARAIHGFGLAAWFYFGRPVSELKVAESALLIGLVRGASFYNPRRHPKRALARRNTVLRVMAAEGVISERQRQRAARRRLGVLGSSRRGAGAADSRFASFLDVVKAQLSRE